LATQMGEPGAGLLPFGEEGKQKLQFSSLAREPPKWQITPNAK